jgi:hypothetical protein
MAVAAISRRPAILLVAVALIFAIEGCREAETGAETCLDAAKRLSEVSTLSQYPEGTTFVRNESACESDGWPYATKVFRYESSATAVLKYYQKILVQDGWNRSSDFPPPPREVPAGEPMTVEGYHRLAEGLDVQLTIVFDDSLGLEPGADDEVNDSSEGSFYAISLFAPDFKDQN